MKSLIEEYGKLIFVALSVLALLSFALSSQSGGFLKLWEDVAIKAMVGTENNDDLLEDYSNRLSPLLEVTTEKLKSDEASDLLSFVTVKKGQVNVVADDGTESVSEVDLEEGKYTLRITKIVGPDGNEMALLDPEPTNGTYLYSFSRLVNEPDSVVELNSYQVTYELTDYYFSDYPVQTTKTYQFVVD